MTNPTQESIQEMMKRLHDQAYKIEVEVLEGGKLPAKAHWNDAGFDVYATDDVEIRPGEIVTHPLNFKVKLPSGVFLKLETKSGLASKGMLVTGGIVDEPYRGIVGLIATNLNWRLMESDPVPGHSPLRISKGSKIAQFTLQPYSNHYYLVQVDKVEEDTERGQGGFGSTGEK